MLREVELFLLRYMRRFLAVLVLICSASPQAAAANCPMAAVTRLAAATVTEEISSSHGSYYTPDKQNSEHHTCQHGAGDCDSLTVCCFLALPSISASPAGTLLVIDVPALVPDNPNISFYLASDPPPPRQLI